MNGSGDGLYYAGSLVYRKRDGVLSLESAGFAGGRFAVTTSGVETRYHVSDHLGSVRAVVSSGGEVLERSDYYPFGLRWEDATQPLSDNRYRYNGKEEQGFVDLPYIDYGARLYDPEYRLGWNGVDPLSEDYLSDSPYHFCGNNPIRYIDPNGMGFDGVPTPHVRTVRLLEMNENFMLYYQTPEEVIEQEPDAPEEEITPPEEPTEPEVEEVEEKSLAGKIMASGMSLALVTSQLDSPLPGPGDAVAIVIAGGTLIVAGVAYFSQHGDNNVSLSPEELEYLLEKRKNTKLSGPERNKIKAHEKFGKKRQSRHSKEEKKQKKTKK